MANPIIELKDVSKRFDNLEILKGLSFQIQPGESVSIVGPSGSGKSTFLHIAGLMEKPTSGGVFVEGKETSKLQDKGLAGLRLNTIGFLFQFHYLLPEFTVLENVMMPARLAGDDLREAKREALVLLERLGLGQRLSHKPTQLSGGEQQRAGLARALIRHPKLLLCDEPTGNLDQHTAQEVADLIWEESKRNGVAIIVVTHNEALAARAENSYCLKDGRFVSMEEKV